MKTEDTEVLGRELNYARSKPDTVNRPVRTSRIFVHHYNNTQYCNTETVFIYIPLPPDQQWQKTQRKNVEIARKNCLRTPRIAFGDHRQTKQ